VPHTLLGLTPLNPWVATALHFGAVWGTTLGMLPALQIAPPPQEWGPKELAFDAFHHGVYAVATGMTLRALTRRSSH
jgi:hypothetical protein